MSLTLRLAWRNLWRHSRRTWLTTGAMVFSNTLLIFLLSLQFSTYELMTENSLKLLTGHVQVQAEGYHDEPAIYRTVPDITPLAEKLRQNLQRETITARAAGFALFSSEQRSFGVQVLGVEPEYEQKVSNLPGLVKQGRYLEQADKDAVIIGGVMARNLKVGVGDEITLLGSGKDGSFAAAILTVTGIFESGINDLDRSLAQISLTSFQEIFSMEGSGHYIVLSGDSAAESDLLKQVITPLIESSVEQELALLDWDQLQPGLKQAIQADIASASFMYVVLVILVAFSVMNTQLMSVLERTREFGIVMAIGLTPGKLSRLIILETTLMAAIGLIGGLIVGGVLTLWIGETGLTYPGAEEMSANFNLDGTFYPVLTPVSALTGPLFVFFASITAALYPAMKLYLLEPISAMRS